MHVRGKERAFAKLKALDDSIEQELAEATLKSAQDVADMAGRLAPKNPATKSEYWRSIKARNLLHIDRQYQGQTYTSRAVGAAGIFASWRWRFVEFGTVNNMAWPHIMPSYRALKKRTKSRISRAINKAVKRIANR